MFTMLMRTVGKMSVLHFLCSMALHWLLRAGVWLRVCKFIRHLLVLLCQQLHSLWPLALLSRPCLTLEMVEDAVHFLSKETMIQAIARSATKVQPFSITAANTFILYFCSLVIS
ncbi:uncharacterized protein LOC124893508 [Capsicum annuum]|uniref:uncharacterized protein LOC124893508 n=1 Tax=Capsicum annuum TaxID=4072 RepID=UPI001FB14BBF|nr:uncharacterized protein LOC124893508 [Capsicum annuum]